MGLSIRLQQHGKKNHPYWWIVVAPQKSNIFGRFTEHIGYWSPREGVNIKRQVVFNIPRLKYWIANGAKPTYKVHKFMHWWGIMPKPWYYKKSAAEIAQRQIPEEEMTDKQKILAERKRKRQERESLPYHNLHSYESRALFPNPLIQKLEAKRNMQDFQNDVIRDVLHQTDYQKFSKINQLANSEDSGKSYYQRLKETKSKLRKYKSELALLEKQHSHSNIILKSQMMEKINKMWKALEALEEERWIYSLPEDATNDEEYVTEEYLNKRLKYELITKKLERLSDEMDKAGKIYEPLTQAEFAQGLKQIFNRKTNQSSLNDEEIFQLAEEFFIACGENNRTLTRMDLLYIEKEESRQQNDLFEEEDDIKYENVQDIPGSEGFYHQDTAKYFANVCLLDDVALPTTRPVHPRPDLFTYFPDEHFDPIDDHNLEIITLDTLDPHEEVEKYHQKRNSKSQSVV